MFGKSAVTFRNDMFDIVIESCTSFFEESAPIDSRDRTIPKELQLHQKPKSLVTQQCFEAITCGSRPNHRGRASKLTGELVQTCLYSFSTSEGATQLKRFEYKTPATVLCLLLSACAGDLAGKNSVPPGVVVTPLSAKVDSHGMPVHINNYKPPVNGAFEAPTNGQEFVFGPGKIAVVRGRPVPPPAPRPIVETPIPPAPHEEEHKTTTVLFRFDSDELTASARHVLIKAVEDYKQADEIEITGNTDSVGPASYNQLLSVRRAESVRTFLAKHGVDRHKMRIRGDGEGHPIASNSTSTGRAKNRRVIIIY